MVQPLITVRGPAHGDSDQLRWPAVDEQLAVRFEDGEILRWRGSGHVAELRRSHAEDPDSVFRAWTIEPLTQLVVTDRRLIYTGQSLKVDRRGPAAQMMAETLRAYNVLPERGRVLVGQIRFGWPVRVSVRPVDHAWPGAALTVTCVDGDSEADLLLLFIKSIGGPSPGDAADGFARALVSDVARFRIADRPFRLTPADEQRLVQQRDHPTSSGTRVRRFDLPGGLPVGSCAGRPPGNGASSRVGQATVDALRLAAEEAGDQRPVDTLDALLGICRLELERWTPVFVRVELSVDALRAEATRSLAPLPATRLAFGDNAGTPELEVTSELEEAVRLAEQIVVRYGFEVVGPSHLALAIALLPCKGSSVLTSGAGVASPTEVVAVLSETLFATTFVGIERLVAERSATGQAALAPPDPPMPQPAAAMVSDREAAWAASPYGRKAATAAPKEPRLRLAERIGAIALFLVLLLVVITIGGLRSTSAAAHDLARGRSALARGDRRQAVQAWADVLRTAPRSLDALVLTSCAEWDIGYADEAVVYYQRALLAGLPWNRLVVSHQCFLNAPMLHGLRTAQIAGMPILYAAPSRKDRAGVALEAIATAAPRASRPQPAQSLLAAACLNDRSDLRLLAAMDMTIALNDPRMPPAHGVLRTCVGRFRGRYGFQTQPNGPEIFLPKDLKDRVFRPNSSPIPGRLPRPLP
jgi:hypothetical protein